jgi:tetratricopeptide (TPR) repeat protein
VHVRSIIRVVGWVMVLALSGRAHLGSVENIARLTEDIAGGDHRPEVYYTRGLEYKTDAQYDLALKDFQTALKEKPDFAPAQQEIAQTYRLKGDLPLALTAAETAVTMAATLPPGFQAECQLELAAIHMQAQRWADALAAIERAFLAVPQGQVDWYKQRARLRQKLGQTALAADELKLGYDRLKSVVLRMEWMELLIEQGRGPEVLPMINAELAECRYRSAWLIRRARVALAQHQPETATEDLTLALGELSLRIHPVEPDVTLLSQQGVAYALLGKRAEAEADLAQLKSLSVEADLTEPIEKSLAASTQSEPKATAPR